LVGTGPVSLNSRSTGRLFLDSLPPLPDINHQFLMALMETIPDRIYFKDREGRFLSVNRAFLEFLGMDGEAGLLGKTDFDIFLPEHAEPARADELAVMASGEPMVAKIEKEVWNDGRVRWVSTSKVPMRDASGAVLGICGISRDVTEEHRQGEKLREYATALAEKQAQIENELDLARQIQGALLPHRYPAFPPEASDETSAIRFAHRYLPMGRVGGDFFTVFPISATQAGVLICDVMGHGVHAALITAVQRVLVEDLLPVAGDPAAFLAELNRRLHDIFQQLKTTLFVTALYAVVDAADGGIRFASAAHPVPLLLEREGGVRALGRGVLPPAPLPLGMLGDSRYAVRHDRMEVGDRLLLFTDGLLDLDRPGQDADDAWFPALAAACAAGAPPESGHFLDALLEKARHVSPTASFLDDVCVVEVGLRRLLG
jgi:sigma-B regulation protein RsbU (phosphoserine phosphatase)